MNRYCLSLGLCVWMASAPVLAQSRWEVLFSAPEGLGLVGLDLAADGNVYAALSSGGTHNLGTLIRRSADGRVSVLHDFEGPEGSQPTAAATLGADGSLYGSAASGGQHGYGTAFRITPAGELIVLHHFTLEDGGAVRVPFTRTRDGRMLGVTSGVYTEDFFPPFTHHLDIRKLGKIFELKPDGTLDILYDGILAPSGRLIETSRGDLYGVKAGITSGLPISRGAVFRLNADRTVSFIQSPGSPGDPRGELVESVDGYLFGMNGESVFRMSMGPDDAEIDFRVMAPYNFYPGGLAFGSDGKLYGGHATFMSLSLAGELKFIRDFNREQQPLTAAIQTDGDGFIVASGDDLYRVELSGSGTALHHFGYQHGIGLEPSSLMITRAGDVYGTTMTGGQHDAGTLFHRDGRGQASAIHHFPRSAEPTLSRLRTPLVEAPDGALYGVTFEEAPRLFRVDAGLVLTTLHVFEAPSTWWSNVEPQSLVAGADGALYGTIALPADANGNIKLLLYRFDLSSHQLTELGAFDKLEPLLATKNGEIYGSSGQVEQQDHQLFRLNAGGERQVLHVFADWPNGHVPDSNLAEGPDGNIYGVAKGRSSATTTVLYRWTRAGKMEIYHVLSNSTDLWPTPIHQVALDANGDAYIKKPYARVVVIFPDKTQQTLPWSSTLGFVTHPNHGAFRIEPLSRDGYSGFNLIPISMR